jgi:hypothetical protein
MKKTIVGSCCLAVALGVGNHGAGGGAYRPVARESKRELPLPLSRGEHPLTFSRVHS